MKKKIFKRLFWFPNRKYKDRLFRRVFSEKKDLLELYNAINGTSYENEKDLEITTIENVIFMSMKNDVSFIVSGVMNLYEHQSTINKNMPIRGLLYFAKLYDDYIKSNDLNIYGKSMIKLPMPQYVVFYNGNENYPDQQILKLSDAFERSEDKMDIHPALECEAKVLNVNYGHNADIMNKCTRLMHYSIFIETVNRNIAEGYSIQQAISNAIDECIGKGILTDILIQNRAEVCHMLLTEFDTKKYGKNMWQEGYSEGHDTGYSEGHDTGYSEGHDTGYSEGHDSGYSTGLSEGCDVTLKIIMKINEGNNTEEKLVSLGYDPELVRKILNNYK